MNEEEWRTVPGFPDYRVSSSGRVISDRLWRGQRGRELRGGSCRGYRSVLLWSPEGQRVNRSVHGLVALAFLGPRPEGMEVRHLDGDKANNAAANLAYGTHAANMADQRRHGTHHNTVKTHCPQGHPYDDENTWTSASRTQRLCRTCARAHVAAHRARQKAAA